MSHPHASKLSSRWWCRALTACGAPVLVFLALEVGLRLAGYGYPTDFFLSSEVNGQPVWIDNWRFAWRFFPRGLARYPTPQVMPQRKPAGTIRIFVLGESAALGVPAPEYGFSRMLRVLLEGRFPGRRVEVVNVSVVAINSHAIRPIAEECAKRDGDLWVVYMGNNEVIGPFGAYGVLGGKTPPGPVIRANLALKATRVGQLLDAGLQRAGGKTAGPAQWRGMQMWQETVARDDARIGRVQAHFRANLEAILDTGHRAGIPIILSTVGCNLKDCSPFASVHRSGLSPTQEAEWEQAFRAGMEREAEGKAAEALAHYQAAARLDERFAELQFRLGNCCLALGQNAEARQHFQRAKDEDALQFRPDTRLNEAIREAAATHGTRGVRLLDAEELFAQRSPASIPGEDLFYEHVHLTPAGNYLLAKATAELAAEITGADGHSGLGTNANPWLPEAECEQRLGLTDWGRFRALQTVEEMIEGPPFTTQSIHSNQIAKLHSALRPLRASTRLPGLRGVLASVQAAVDRDPTDPELLAILAPMLEAYGDPQGAERRWREVTQLLPQAPIPYLNLAQLLGRQGRDEAAAAAYEASLHRNPDSTEAHGGLGALRLRQGRPAEAIPHLRLVVRQQPESVDGHWVLGQALWKVKRRPEAVAEFREVLRLEPSHAEAKRILEEVQGEAPPR